MSNFFNWTFWQSVVSSVVGAIIVGAATALFSMTLRKLLSQRDTTSLNNARWIFVATFVIATAAEIIYLYNNWPQPAVFIAVTSLITAILIWRELDHFWSVGILRADRTIENGLNYDSALQLCKNSLDFAGLGADKLVHSESFESTLAQCNRKERPIRFLLARPDSKFLIDAARQALQPDHTYSEKVIHSLRKLAELRNRRAFNVEVRFYSITDAPPDFRLMFIDETLCLVSYYRLGEGSGSQLPQICVAKFGLGKRDVGSFFYAYHQLFTHQWKAAEGSIWNFTDFLGPTAQEQTNQGTI